MAEWGRTSCHLSNTLIFLSAIYCNTFDKVKKTFAVSSSCYESRAQCMLLKSLLFFSSGLTLIISLSVNSATIIIMGFLFRRVIKGEWGN